MSVGLQWIYIPLPITFWSLYIMWWFEVKYNFNAEYIYSLALERETQILQLLSLYLMYEILLAPNSIWTTVMEKMAVGGNR